jgi:type IV pilus assembly protein PilM
MAGPARLITLNLGSQTIGLAEFRVAHGSLSLVDYRLAEAPLDPETGQRRDAHLALSETAAVLRQMMREMQIHHAPVFYAVPSQSVFARFVKLPALHTPKIDKIIEFEAQQNVPFPLHEVVWDYQLVGGGVDEEIQVVIVAIKRDLLEEMNSAVEETGLRTRIVDVASMSLYNAFRYSYPGSGDCSLLVDIGARTTNVLFIESAKFFLRSIPLGGNAITAGVAREFNESFALAEARKKRDTLVAVGSAHVEAGDSDNARVAKIARSTMIRLHAELMRSVTHYRTQQQGNLPARIYLCGGGAGMPYVREFFHEKFQVPIDLFDPLRNVTVSESCRSDGKDTAQSAHLLGELVGLALRCFTPCAVELNLRPAAVVRRHDLEKRRPFFIAAAVCILAALLGWSAYYTWAAQFAEHAAETIRQRNDTMHVSEVRLDKLKKEITALDNTAAPLIAAVNDRNFWPQILEELSSRLPDSDIWITELAASSGGKLVGTPEKRAGEAAPVPQPTPPTPAVRSASASGRMIDGINVRGLYLYNPKQQEIVVDYLRNLANSSLFSVNAKMPERFIKSNSVPTDSEWAFPYELQLTLRRPVKMP